MNAVVKRAISLLLVLCLATVCLLPSSTVPAEAAQSSSAPKRFNIMLVIDGSGSLETEDRTDPDRMRYELVSDLLGNLENEGHTLGAVVFSGTTKKDTSSMEKGIMLNTGLLSLDTLGPKGLPVKEYIYNQIVDTGYDRTRNGTTDVGTALLVAERTLLEKQKENGLESLIFLFTDGVTDLPSKALMNQSKENLNTATSEISGTDNVRLMGIFLNKKGKLPSKEIKGIVCAANGISESSEEFNNSYVEIHNAASAHQAVAVMLRFMGYISNQEPTVIYDNLDDTFTVPGIGVEGINIRLYSPNGQTLPKMTVVLTRPDGTELKGAELNAIGRFGRTFHVYQLVSPMPGTWNLHIEVPKGNKVGYCYDPVISLHVDAGMEVSPDPASWHVNKEVTFTGYLSQGGTKVTDPTSYREYVCTLVITNLMDGSVETFEIPTTTSGIFQLTHKLDKYGLFEAQILFTCDEIIVASNAIEYQLINNAPAAESPAKVKVTYGLFHNSIHDIDLTRYFADTEDGHNVTIRLQATDCPTDSYTLEGTQLQLNATKLSTNTMDLVIEDSQGSITPLQLAITSTNATALMVTLLIIAAVLLVIAICVVIWIFLSVKPKGSLKLTFSNDSADSEPQSIYLGVPNANADSVTNLYKLIRDALSKNVTGLPQEVAEELKNIIRSNQRALNGIRIRCVVKLLQGKLTGMIGITDNGDKTVLYDSAWSTKIDGVSYTLTFTVAKKSRKDNPDDDLFSDFEENSDDFVSNDDDLFSDSDN